MSLVVRFVGILVLILGLGLFTYFGLPYLRFTMATPAERLQVLWEQDVEMLKAAKKLPADFDRLKEIQLIPATDNAKAWLKRVRVPLRVYEDGTHKMEILLLSFEEPGITGAIVQYNLVDLKTENMVWELGRTFVLEGDPDLEKLNPAEPQPVEASTAPKAPARAGEK